MIVPDNPTNADLVGIILELNVAVKTLVKQLNILGAQ